MHNDANAGEREMPEFGRRLIEDALAATVARDWTTAAQCWEKAHVLHVEAFSESDYLGYGRALRWLRQWDDADLLIEEALRTHPASARLLAEQARVATGRKDWPQALGRWIAVGAVLGAMADASVQFEIARAQRMTGAYVEAEATLNAALSADPDFMPLLSEFAELAVARKAWPEAAVRWAQILAASGDKATPNVFLQLSLVKRELGEISEAVEVVRRGTEAFPMDVLLLRREAQLAGAVGDWRGAADRWREVVSLSGPNPSISDVDHHGSAQRAKVVNDRVLLDLRFAESATAQRRWREAADRWRTLLEIVPSEFRSLCAVRLSAACRRLGEFDEAECALLDTHSIDLPIRVAEAELAMARRDWSTAADIWNELQKTFPDSAPVRARLSLSVCRRALAGNLAGETNEGLEWDDNALHTAELNGLHRGETLYLLGAGPSLSDLQPEDVARLNKAVTLGVNRVPYKVPLDYFLSAYPSEIMLAGRVSPRTQRIHMRPRYAPPIDDGALAVRRIERREGQAMPTALDAVEPTILTKSNVLFGALGLARVMQPARIVLYGFEQRDASHFYDREPAIGRRIFDDLLAVAATHESLFTADHHYCTLQFLLRYDAVQSEVGATRPFHPRYDHTSLLRSLFDEFKAEGVEIVSAVEDSIAVDAGASYRPLSEMLP